MKNVSEILTTVYSLCWNNLNILECGANVNGEETRALMSTNNCWYVEANPTDYQVLKTIKPNALNLALSDKDGSIEFTISSHPGNSSCEHSSAHLEELKKYNAIFSKMQVPCITYESLLKRLNLVFDVLVLDIEGHEAVVLNSWKHIPNDLLPQIIAIECGYDWNVRLSLLKNLGYKIDCYYFNNCYLSKPKTPVNQSTAKIYNTEWKNFEWNNKTIYTNELIDDSHL